MFTVRIMLRIYQRPTGGSMTSGEDLRRDFVNNAGGSQVPRFEGMAAVDYMLEGRAAVIGPTWLGNVLHYAVVCM